MSDLIPASVLSGLPERYRRRALEIAQRVADIDALITPCRVEDIRDAVVRLRGQLRPQPDTDPAELAAEFKAACRDLPAWAISEAANDFLRGLVENHTGQYMPTCAEFAKRARHIVMPFLAERSLLRNEAERLAERAADDMRRAAIEADRRNPAVRKRVAEMIEAAQAGLPQQASIPHKGLSPDDQARLDSFKKQTPFVSRLAETRIVKGE
jgi:hypothetical protein